MAMVCPKCSGVFDQQMQCPLCGVRLQFTALGQQTFGGIGIDESDWQQTTLGRIIIGLLFAQGLALGLRLFVDASTFAPADQVQEGQRASLYGVMVMQGLHALCLLVASVLAGAGQHRGLMAGAMIGLFNGVLLLGWQHIQGQHLTPMILYGQPLLHLFVGAIGGLAGSLIWKPLPIVQLAPAGQKRIKKPVRNNQHFSGPIAWFRVLIGTAVVVAGVASPMIIVNFVIDYSFGELTITSGFQFRVIVWEIIGLAILFGAGIAGFNTFNGPKQGICVGIFSSLLVAGYKIADGRYILEEVVFTVLVILGLSLAGSWFSSRLFPPVAPRRRRLSGTP